MPELLDHPTRPRLRPGARPPPPATPASPSSRRRVAPRDARVSPGDGGRRSVGARRRVLAPRARHGDRRPSRERARARRAGGAARGRLPSAAAGARAVAALTAGPLMIVAGVVDGVRHVAVDRLGGDDVTAILCGVAGAACSCSARPAVALAPARRAPAAALPAAGARRRRRGAGGRVRRRAGRVRDRRPTTRRARRSSRRTSAGRISTCR